MSDTKQNKDSVSLVCDFISRNLDDEMSLESLSEIAGFSKYHFHRLFRARMGLSLYDYVQLSRLKRASYRLAFHPAERIIDIALEAGFERPEAFSKAFKRRFGQSPSGFRKAPDWPLWQSRFVFVHPEGEKMKLDVEIVTFPTTLVAALEHHGPPSELQNTVARFIEWRKSTGISPRGSMKTFGVPWNDPNAVEPKDFRWDVCGQVTEPVPKNDFGVVTKSIPGGWCAHVIHEGSQDNMERTIYPLYRQWLPESGEKTRDFPVFFQYHNFFPEVPEVELTASIYLPIE